MADVWYCTYCGEPHSPIRDPVTGSAYTMLDPRYTTGRCEGHVRPLIRDRDEALRLAYTERGKFKPKPNG